jgi:putative endonuclease
VEVTLYDMSWVYILRCADGSFYVGSTRNLERRLAEHNSAEDGAKYTRHRQPVELVWAAECEHIGEAFALEKQIQGWSRRKRQALIDGDYDLVVTLAKRRAGRPRP